MHSPPDPASYNAIVYEIVRQVPPGRVVAYGQIAAMIPPPSSVDPLQYARLGPRWVGNAMADCPEEVPWQRVINGEGKISRRKNSEGHLLQGALLEGEGVRFDDDDAVDFDRFEWEGPSEDWLLARELRLLNRKATGKSKRSFLFRE